jgi:integrase
VSALRFLFIKTLHRHFLAEYIPFPKAHKRLPTVLSPEEVARLIDSARNLYHRTLLMTLYSTAMRRAELCQLKVRDIDSQRMMIRINQGKGSRDREVPLSPKLLRDPARLLALDAAHNLSLSRYREESARRRAHQRQRRLISLPPSRSSRRHLQTHFSTLSTPLCTLPDYVS